MKNSDDTNTCCRARCSRPATLIYLGAPLCDRHWLIHCEEEEQKEEADNGDD